MERGQYPGGCCPDAIKHPEACIEVGFPVEDVRMKEAAN
jgi:hypothetical protein